MTRRRLPPIGIGPLRPGARGWPATGGGHLYRMDPGNPNLRPSPYEDATAFEPDMLDIPLTDEEMQADLPRVVTLEELPLEEASAPQIIRDDNLVQVCKRRITYAKALTALVRVMPPNEGTITLAAGDTIGQTVSPPATDATNAFNVSNIPATSSLVLPNNIQQALEVIAFVKCGHGDLSMEIAVNVPYGQIIRISQMASVMQVDARVTSRYYPSITVGGVVSWLVGADGSSFARNELFNNPPPVSINGPTLRPLQMQGFVGEGFTSPVPPSRNFFGWVEPLAVQNTQHLCPVPRGAQTVILISDATSTNNDPGASEAFNGVMLQFNMICKSPGGATTRRVLNAPPFTTVPLRSDCVALELCNVDVPAAGIGVPFEFQYDVGF